MTQTGVTDLSARARIHVVDDDTGLRAALTDLLESTGYEVLTYGSTAEFLARDRGCEPGCLILDVRLPGMSGLELQEKLASDGITLPVILITGFGNVPMSVRGMKAGALDFIEKPFRDQAILDAVANAVEVSRRTVPLAPRRAVLEQRHACLSRREREVMGLVIRGQRNKQIAYALSISEGTVKAHRSNLIRKMKARSVAELGRMAEVLGL
jgi:FixJ family two-component response regulator